MGLVIKLFPVISWLTRERSDLSVVMQMPTHERLGIAYALDRADLCDAVDAAIEALRTSLLSKSNMALLLARAASIALRLMLSTPLDQVV
jgi:hypothetical protein